MPLIMKMLLSLACLCLLTFSSCSSDDSVDVDDSAVIGSWKLASYIIEIPFDINKDGIKSLNLLNEINCPVGETLIFETNGSFSSNDTFNHQIKISQSALNNEYIFDVECSEGYISFASEYVINSDQTIFMNNLPFAYAIEGNKMTRVFENFIEVYNEELSEVIDRKDLTLIYTKQ